MQLKSSSGIARANNAIRKLPNGTGRRVLFCAAFAVTGLLLSDRADAQIWTGTTSSNMTTAGNWNPAVVPNTTSSITFPNLASQRYSVTTGGFTAQSYTFTSSVDYTFSGGGTQTFASSVANTGSIVLSGTGNVNFTNPATITNSTYFLANGGNLTFSGNFTQPAGTILFLQPAVGRTIAFTGSIGTPANTLFRNNAGGGGTVTLAPASFCTINTLECNAGFTQVTTNFLFVPNTQITGGTLRLLPPASGTLTQQLQVYSGTLDYQSSQSLLTINMTGGLITSTAGSPIFGAQALIAVSQQATAPRFAGQFNIAGIFATSNAGSGSYDLDIDGASVGSNTTYSWTGSSLIPSRFRFLPGSASSTTTQAAAVGTIFFNLDGGQPVAPGGTVTVTGGTLTLSSPSTTRLLDASVYVPSGSTLGFGGPNKSAITYVRLSSGGVMNLNEFGNPKDVDVFGTVNANGVSAPATVSRFIQMQSGGTLNVVNGSQGLSAQSFLNFAGTVNFGFTSSSITYTGVFVNYSTLNLAGSNNGVDIQGSFQCWPGSSVNFQGVKRRFVVSSNNPGDIMSLLAPITISYPNSYVAEGVCSFQNGSTLTLDNGTIELRNGSNHQNSGLLTGNGNITELNTSGPEVAFTNDGTIRPTGGGIYCTGSLLLVNRYGTINLDTGTYLSVNDFSNSGAVNLTGGSLNGFYNSTNAAGGSITGYGKLYSLINNAGLVRVTNSGLLQVSSSINNSGSIRVDDGNFQVSGVLTNTGLVNVGPNGVLSSPFGFVTNSGRVMGGGLISVSVINAPNGRIEPTGTLQFTVAPTIQAGSTLILGNGNTLLLQAGLVGNALPGLVNLGGGTLDVTGFNVTNASTGTISGFGTVLAASLRNSGLITFAGGTSFINAPVTNDANRTIRVDSGTAIFNYPVTNNGILRVNNGNAVFVSTLNGVPQGNGSTAVALGGGGTVTVTAAGYLETDGLNQNALSLQGAAGSPGVAVIPSREPTGDVTSTGRVNPPALVQINSLSVGISGGAYTGLLDLTTNDMLLRSSSPTSDLNLLRSLAQAYLTSNGAVGMGTSSGQPYVRLAVFRNDTGLFNGSSTPSGIAYYPSFDGVTALSTDVFVHFTYAADLNADGVVDGRDYKRFMEGLVLNIGQWQWGDQNYDGVVNATDAQLFVQAYNATYGAPSLGSPSDAAIGGTSVIPEPGAMAVPLMAAVGLRRRRR
jgi:hypothetical protein